MSNLVVFVALIRSNEDDLYGLLNWLLLPNVLKQNSQRHSFKESDSLTSSLLGLPL